MQQFFSSPFYIHFRLAFFECIRTIAKHNGDHDSDDDKEESGRNKQECIAARVQVYATFHKRSSLYLMNATLSTVLFFNVSSLLFLFSAHFVIIVLHNYFQFVVAVESSPLIGVCIRLLD